MSKQTMQQIPASVLAKAYGINADQIRGCLHYSYRDEKDQLVKSYTRASLDEPFTDTTSLDIERERLARVEAEQARFKQRLLEEACLTASSDTSDADEDVPWNDEDDA